MPDPANASITATPAAGSPATGTVLVLGAGTMGAGIAQVAATSGWTARVMDLDADRLASAISGVRSRIDRMQEKGRLDEAAADAARARLEVADGPAAAAGCDLVLEAIVEDMDAKVAALSALLPHLGPDAIIATNTSSLSVAELGERLGEPARTVGMHFFNPAPLLKLVEVIPGAGTDEAVVARTRAIAESWDKIVAVAKDAPGFIVNHVARPYYLEAFRVLADGVADVACIDGVMRTAGRFRMGPFELTDLIGQDVNTATTRSVWERLGQPALLAPSELQESLVTEGDLGRKTGRGVYNHTADPPLPVLTVRTKPLPEDEAFVGAAIAFEASAADAVGGQSSTDPRSAVAFGRILLALITQAQRAAALGIGSPADIDTALRYGVNYPLGPLAWAESIGTTRLDAWRAALLAQPGGERFAAEG
jgi:3-hydroxybutyryl-CoA dehydrogenase